MGLTTCWVGADVYAGNEVKGWVYSVYYIANTHTSTITPLSPIPISLSKKHIRERKRNCACFVIICPTFPVNPNSARLTKMQLTFARLYVVFKQSGSIVLQRRLNVRAAAKRESLLVSGRLGGSGRRFGAAVQFSSFPV